MKKIAVVLFNLGGPDDQGSVRRFLFNLFNDRAIINLPTPLRFFLAVIISIKRSKKARHIYQQIGGKSPILEQTQKQAQALSDILSSRSKGDEYKIFVSMRYWHPMSEAAIKNVKNYSPDKIILLPLYPQFSSTTTASSFSDWDNKCANLGLNVPTIRICCYPTQKSFIASHARKIRDSYWKAAEYGKPRVLFSAHGLPEKVIKSGDPYQYQIEKTSAAVAQILAVDDLDYRVCYQSKVGPLTWIGPSTEEEIEIAARERKPLVIVPIAFVSEHSETLVELDLEYRALAEKLGVVSYQRVAALGVDEFYIEALAEMVLAKNQATGISPEAKERFCPREFGFCPCNEETI